MGRGREQGPGSASLLFYSLTQAWGRGRRAAPPTASSKDTFLCPHPSPKEGQVGGIEVRLPGEEETQFGQQGYCHLQCNLFPGNQPDADDPGKDPSGLEGRRLLDERGLILKSPGGEEHRSWPTGDYSCKKYSHIVWAPLKIRGMFVTAAGLPWLTYWVWSMLQNSHVLTRHPSLCKLL